MQLGELITRLEAANPDQIVAHGFHNPHSYRGDYYDLAFEPTADITVADMLEAARSAVGTTYQGWKGGDFTMSEHSWCWLSDEGDASGETISPLLLDLLLADSSSTPDASRLEAAARRALDSLAAFILDTSDPGVEALGAQYELRHALLLDTPPIPTDRVWQVQVQRRNGSWIDHSPATSDGRQAHADYEDTIASSGHLWSYRLVCSVRAHTIEAQHDRPEET